MKYIVSYSGGLGSFAAAYLTVSKYGKENVHLVFCDTKTEDEDLYRFIDQTVKALGCEYTVLSDGRDIWQVFKDVRFMGNSRIDPCSRLLKRDLFKKWLASEYTPQSASLVVGIGNDESHRMSAIEFNYEPFQVVAPLIDTPMTREEIIGVLEKFNIDPPRLYDMGFPHNNCGGFCVKTGQRQMKMLLEKLPEKYAHHERNQEDLFSLLGKRHGFIRMTVDGEMHYLGLREFREHVQSGGKCEMFEAKGCGCMV